MPPFAHLTPSEAFHHASFAAVHLIEAADKTRRPPRAGSQSPHQSSEPESHDAHAPLAEEDFAEADTLDVNDPRIVLRPDGYHWLSEGGRIENGPFDSARAAWADMHAADEDAPTAEDDLGEVSAEIGIADWVDPDTGVLAEGTIPHLSEE